MTTRRLCSAVTLLVLAPVLAARAADAEPLPAGAKARLGTPCGPESGPFLLAPDFQTFLTGTVDGPRLKDVRTGKSTPIPGPADGEGRVILAVSADGKRAVTDRAGAYLVFEVPSGKEVRTIKGQALVGYRLTRGAYPISLSADGSVLAFPVRSTTDGKRTKLEVVVWDVAKDEQRARVTALQDQTVVPVLSPDGKRLATYGDSTFVANLPANEPQPASALQLWDAVTGRAIATLADALPSYAPPHLRVPVIFSPDGKWLAVGDAESLSGPIRLWEANTGEPREPILCRPHNGGAMAISPDGRTLAAVGPNGSVERWSLPDGKPLKSTPFPAADLIVKGWDLKTGGLAFADNERVVAWVGLFGRALVWEAPSGKLLTPITGHAGAIQAVQFAADGAEVVTTGADYRTLHWDRAGNRLGAVPVRLSDSFGPPDHLAPGAARGLRHGLVYDLKAGEELFVLPLSYVVPSPDFSRAAGLRNAGRPAGPQWCEVWDLEARRRLARMELPGPSDARLLADSTMAFSPDNTRLVTVVRVRDTEPGAGAVTVVTGWDVKTGKKLGELRESIGEGFVQVAAAGNNSGAVLATDDGKLWVADYERGARGETIAACPGPRQRFSRPTFSPDGKTFAVGAPTESRDAFAVRVYDWPRGHLLRTFTGHTAAVTALAFSPDGKTLASGSADGTAVLWDVSAVK